MRQYPPRRGWRDWYDLMILDHGFLRLFWHNRHEVSHGVWRSNQPSPAQIRKAAAMGVKTIVNLRGARADGVWRLEKQACDACGMRLVDFTIRSRAVPDAETIAEADKIFSTIEYPMLMHCKSGADRAGIMSALYLLLCKDARAAEAAAMLSLKYLHVRQAKTGLLDAFIEAFAKAENESKTFRDWAKHDLDPAAIERDFKAQGWAQKWSNRLVDDWLKRE